MNATDNFSNSSKSVCGRQINDDYDTFFTVLSIIMNLLTCPLITLLNTIIIIALKTNRMLRTMHNILLGSMAVTDLAVGTVVQPLFITQEIVLIAGGSLSLYCKFRQIHSALTPIVCILSVLHCALIAVERFVAMKYSLRYDSIVTKFRLIVTVSCCWFIVIVYWLTRILYKALFPSSAFIFLSLPVIIYCHTSVYFVCRRHLAQIKSEQVSREESTKFLNERKAWKTTAIIIAGIVICYAPGFLSPVVLRNRIGIRLSSFPIFERISFSSQPFRLSFYMLNSLLNPIIYCWRSTEIRQATLQLLKKQEN